MIELYNSFAAYLQGFLFGIYPYICMGVFVIGSLIRFDRDQYTWRSGSSQMLRARQLRWGSNLFHYSIFFLFFGHLIGLLTPHWGYAWAISPESKQLLAVYSGGAAGIVCFIGLSMLLHRRLFDLRIRRTSTFADMAILVLLWVQLTLGLITLPFSLGHEDAGIMLALASWSQAIVTFQARASELVIGLPFPYLAHLVLGMTLFLLTPFSRLVHIFSAPVWYLFRAWQIVRVRGGATARPGPVVRPGFEPTPPSVVAAQRQRVPAE